MALADPLVVLGVRADPKPKHAVRNRSAGGTMMQAHARGPKLANFLEVKRRMSGVRLEQSKCPVGGLSYRSGKKLIACPEIRCGIVIHSFVERPARWSRRARSAMASSFPALTSVSN